MRIIVIIVMLCAVLLVFTGCTLNNVQSTEDTRNTAVPKETIRGSECIRLMYFEDLALYNEYITTTDLPNEFITADMLESIGSFAYFLEQSDFSSGDYSAYYYDLIDTDGNVIGLCIDHTPSESSVIDDTISIPTDVPSLLDLGTDVSGEFYRGGVQYTYRGGLLRVVTWTMNGIEFMLTNDTFGGWEKPLPKVDGETFLSKILSTSDTVFLEAMEILQSAITNDVK